MYGNIENINISLPKQSNNDILVYDGTSELQNEYYLNTYPVSNSPTNDIHHKVLRSYRAKLKKNPLLENETPPQKYNIYYHSICYATSKSLLKHCNNNKHHPQYVQHRLNSRNSIICSLCEVEYSKTDYFYDCKQCDYHICTSCMGRDNLDYDKKLKSQQSEPSNIDNDELYEPNNDDIQILSPEERRTRSTPSIIT